MFFSLKELFKYIWIMHFFALKVSNILTRNYRKCDSKTFMPLGIQDRKTFILDIVNICKPQI